jgi:uncharacterized hydantoinase/oxoprolinase family protein
MIEMINCPNCLGTGTDGTDRSVPPNPYICEKCDGSGKIVNISTRSVLIDAILELASDEVSEDYIIEIAKNSKKELITKVISMAIWYKDAYNEKE